MTQNADDWEVSTEPPEYSLIFYIHGDGDYLYHTPDGEPIQADQHALYKALSVARNAENGQVIIFHRQAERSVLGLFPRKTSRFLIYQNGERKLSLKYRNSSEGSFMSEEMRLFQTHVSTVSDKGPLSHFLYFGHEIPLNTVKGYHESVPDDLWGTQLFAEQISGFLQDDQDRFGLLALSTCSNGTPAMVSQLTPLTKTLLASPQNLHLSHLDVNRLTALESDSQLADQPLKLARMLADDTFSRLSQELQTDVTLAVYDIDSLTSLDSLQQLAENYHRQHSVNFNRDNTDCARLLQTDIDPYTQGVTTFYKPARFGTQTSGRSHSGWGCKPKQSHTVNMLN